jgi:hypothetical protein
VRLPRQANLSDEVRALLIVGAVAVCACACDSPTAIATSSSGSARPEIAVKRTDRLEPEYDKSGKLQKLQYDRNGDGRVDTWGYMDGARVVRVEVDENGDGAVDRWEFHRAASARPDRASPGTTAAAPAGPDKTVERIERATRFDGQVSRREYFDNGTLTKIEEDTDGNGKVDKWETYTDGALSLMALDTSGRGAPDRRLVYRADGSLDRIEEDPTGSGTFRPLKP